MNEDPRLGARIALLEEAARRQPSVTVYHNLARLCLDRGDGAAAASACARAAEHGRDGVRIEPIIAAGDRGPYPPEVQIRRARMLMDQGYVTSAVLSQLAWASAVVGDEAAVGSLMDYDRFYHCRPFAAAGRLPLRRIADIFLESPSRYGEPSERAIRHASRYNAITTASERPEIATLAGVLREASADYIGKIREETREHHPFTASIPSAFEIEAWGVISGREGYHKSHIHQRAWASGVLYVVAPDCAADPARRIGWLRVGPPDELAAAAARWEERWVQPVPGLVVMIPAYFSHETLPMEREDERICVAFDIVPR